MRVDGHLNAGQYQAMIAASGVIELMKARHRQKVGFSNTMGHRHTRRKEPNNFWSLSV
jgi:hypothetical protein